MTSPKTRFRHACDRYADPATSERMEVLASEIRQASLHAAELRRRADAPQESQLCLSDALHALDHAHAELMAAQDELSQRADELLTARVEHELEWLRYRDLFEAAPVAYLETDARGYVIESNRCCSELLNIPAHLLVDKPLVVFVAQPDRLAFRHSLEHLESHTGRASVRLHLQPRDTLDLVAVRADVVAVDASVGRTRAYRWAFSLSSNPAETRPQRSQRLVLSDASACVTRRLGTRRLGMRRRPCDRK